MMHTSPKSLSLYNLFLLVGIIVVSTMLAPVSFAQGENVALVNGREIDTLRYIEHQGSPYQFADWVKGSVISDNFHRFYDIKLNYNGYTTEFEVRRKNEYIELDARYYVRIEVPNPNHAKLDTLIFQKGIIPGKPSKFVQLLFIGSDHLFFKTFEVNLKTVSSRTVGGIVENKRFTGKYNYYLMFDGKTVPIRLKKKKILQLFEKPKIVEEIIANEQIDCSEEEGLMRLLHLMEQTESR